jgi:putative thiamine transport system permease protein
MAPALRPVTPGATAGATTPARPRRLDLPGLLPSLTVALFLLPIGAGLLGTLLPAFGWLPALGGEHLSLAPWRSLLAEPGLAHAVTLSLTGGLGATLVALVLALGFCAACHDTAGMRLARRLLASLLAVPHVSAAIALAFLIAPSGWILRLLSPWATGSSLPPDLLTLQDRQGLALALGLVVKETPYLLLMCLAGLGQLDAGRSLQLARGLGYGAAAAWLKTLLPRLYPLIRLPVYAVLAYGLSVVDMALILGPATPPPLAPLVVRWSNDADLAWRFPAAAGACLQLLLAVGAILLWGAGERLAARLARPWLSDGRRLAGLDRPARLAAGTAVGAILALSAAGLLAMALWSLAARWPFPAALPTAWTLDNWRRGLAGLAWPLSTTLIAGGITAALALALALGCLENEQRRRMAAPTRSLWLLYLPLLVPQVSFLFGLQTVLVALDLDGGWAALVWSHLLFVLPYVFLTLADPYRALDERYARSAACLGAGPARIFWRIKLPLLRRPLLAALAVGFAVSVGLYLPTVYAGAGRFATLATEAVTLAAGADRRLIGVETFLQSLLPLAGFALALGVAGRRLRPAGRSPA